MLVNYTCHLFCSIYCDIINIIFIIIIFYFFCSGFFLSLPICSKCLKKFLIAFKMAFMYEIRLSFSFSSFSFLILKYLTSFCMFSLSFSRDLYNLAYSPTSLCYLVSIVITHHYPFLNNKKTNISVSNILLSNL